MTGVPHPTVKRARDNSSLFPMPSSRLQNLRSGKNTSRSSSVKGLPAAVGAGAATLPRNVLNVVLGDTLFKTWYSSFYPEELVGKHTERLYVCEWCFKYAVKVEDYVAHRVRLSLYLMWVSLTSMFRRYVSSRMRRWGERSIRKSHMRSTK